MTSEEVAALYDQLDTAIRRILADKGSPILRPQSDTVKGCTVFFNQDMRADDAEAYLSAIRLLLVVERVEPIRAKGN